MFDKTQIVPKREDCQTFFESSFMSIKSDLCDIANTYLHIAFKVHEIDARIRRDGKKCKYKNIVEACEIELGFKKSTTYNMLNIVKTYGLDENGNVSYKQLITYNRYSYSQLVEMLSLGDVQRSRVTPDTPVSGIRALKAAETRKQNSSRRLEIFENTSDVVQTSGREVEAEIVINSSGQFEIFPPAGVVLEDFLHFEIEKCEGTVFYKDSDLLVRFNEEFFDVVQFLSKFFDDLEYSLNPVFSDSDSCLNSDIIKELPDTSEVVDKFNLCISLFSNTVNAFKKLNK